MAVTIANTADTYELVSGGSTLLNGLISYWKMDESSGNLADSVASNTGVVTGSPTYNGSGIKVGVTFDGINDYFHCGDDSSLKPNYFTISFWMKSSYGANYLALCGHGISISPYGWVGATELDGGGAAHVRFEGYNATGTEYYQVDATTNVITGAWVHVVMSINGTYAKVYINTVQEGGDVSFPYTQGYTTGETEFMIGRNVPYGLLYNGELDEIGLWNRALTTDV